MPAGRIAAGAVPEPPCFETQGLAPDSAWSEPSVPQPAWDESDMGAAGGLLDEVQVALVFNLERLTASFHRMLRLFKNCWL